MQKRTNLDIITASAGSGKTHILTEEYVNRLKEDAGYAAVTAFSNLAITFTNKATAEMKERILAKIAESGDDITLRHLLHHWGEVNISTIDSFVKRAYDSIPFKNKYSRKVILDEEDILDKAADKVLAKTESVQTLQKRFYEMSTRRLYDGKSWNIKGAIKEIAARHLDEPLMLARMENHAGIADERIIDNAETLAQQTQASFLESLRLIGAEGLDAMDAAGRPAESFKGKSRSPMTIFAKWAEGCIKEPPAKLADCSSETDDAAIQGVIAKALELFMEPWREYKTAAVILENVPSMRLYGILGKAIWDTLEEEDAEMLKLGAWDLASVLNENGVALLEEYGFFMPRHVLIDEAQDTSALQWENIRYVVDAALRKERGDALLVGDAKQSIYRWRNSDWRILAEKAEATLRKARASHRTLTENWRSSVAVVSLVNTVFTAAADTLATMGLPKESDHIRRIYAGAEETIPQQRAAKATDGYAAIRFLNANTWRNDALDMMTRDIANMLTQGYRPGDITVLVRRGSEAAAVTRHLQENGYAVATDEALKVGANTTVNRIIAALRATAFPDEPITQLTAAELEAPDAIKEQNSLVETVMAVIAATDSENGDGPYLDALLDLAVLRQREDGDTLPSFIEWWDAKGCMTPVAAQENKGAIRVMTIHKSKGLSLEAVIIPFMAEPLATPTTLAPTIWCKAKGKYADLDIIPVRAYENRLRGTDYEEDYERERLDQCADTMNVMYVAMTRAKSRLYAYCPDKAGKATFENMVHEILIGEGQETAYAIGEENLHKAAFIDERKALDISDIPFRGKPLERAVLKIAKDEA